MSRPDLPDDLVDEILYRVPATYLKGLRTTCQRWNRLYKDRRFVRKHLDKSPKQFLSVMRTWNHRICSMSIGLTIPLFSSIVVPSVHFKPEVSLFDPNNPAFGFKIYRVFHCDGLLLCSSADEARMVVWNPLTGETRWIQPSKFPTKGQTFYLGSCNNKCYKILCSALCRDDSEMYDFSSDSWRVLGYNIAPGLSLSFSYQCVSVKGNAYMFATDLAETHISLSLLKFDFSTEKSVTMPLPRHWHTHRSTILSVVREEKIALLLKQEPTSKTEIWVTNKIDQATKVVSWSMILSLDLSSDIRMVDNSTFLLDEEKKLLVCCTKLLFRNRVSDKIWIVGEDSKDTKVDFGRTETRRVYATIHNYVPSLVRIDQAGHKRKRGDS